MDAELNGIATQKVFPNCQFFPSVLPQTDLKNIVKTKVNGRRFSSWRAKNFMVLEPRKAVNTKAQVRGETSSKYTVNGYYGTSDKDEIITNHTSEAISSDVYVLRMTEQITKA